MADNHGDWDQFAQNQIDAWNGPDPRGLRDSPPYNQGGTFDDMRRHLDSFPQIIEGQRYVHIPDRRLERIQPTDYNMRQCERCGMAILVYRPGKCPSCWRSLRPTLPAAMLGAQLCICPCTCPPEVDDPDDSDFVPDDSDEEVNIAPLPAPNVQQPQVLAAATLTNNQGTQNQHSYNAEDPSNYHAAVERQPAGNAYSSVASQANAVEWNEAAILFRQPFRLELAHLLWRGYSRDDLRRMFHETRDGRSTAYLPPDRILPPQAPATCWSCLRAYGPALQTAIGMAFLRSWITIEVARSAAAQTAFPHQGLLEQMSAYSADTPYVALCRQCSLPFRPPGYLRDSPGQCSCRCICENPQVSDSSSSN